MGSRHEIAIDVPLDHMQSAVEREESQRSTTRTMTREEKSTREVAARAIASTGCGTVRPAHVLSGWRRL
jgi:hypothetical protein